MHWPRYLASITARDVPNDHDAICCNRPCHLAALLGHWYGRRKRVSPISKLRSFRSFQQFFSHISRPWYNSGLDSDHPASTTGVGCIILDGNTQAAGSLLVNAYGVLNCRILLSDQECQWMFFSRSQQFPRTSIQGELEDRPCKDLGWLTAVSLFASQEPASLQVRLLSKVSNVQRHVPEAGLILYSQEEFGGTRAIDSVLHDELAWGRFK